MSSSIHHTHIHISSQSTSSHKQKQHAVLITQIIPHITMVHWINAERRKLTGTATTDYNMDEIKL